MPDRFIQIENLRLGTITVIILRDEDEMAATFSAEHRALLDRGHTIRLMDQLIVDLQAFLRANRALPQAMLQLPPAPRPVTQAAEARRSRSTPVNIRARRAGVQQIAGA